MAIVKSVEKMTQNSLALMEKGAAANFADLHISNNIPFCKIQNRNVNLSRLSPYQRLHIIQLEYCNPLA